MTRRRVLPRRDELVTGFGPPLLRLCDGTGVLGAALVDQEGETVDYAGVIDPFDIKIAAAEWRLVLETLRESRIEGWSCTQQMVVRCSKTSFIAVPLSDGYALVAQLLRHSFGLSARALSEATRDICREGGLPLPPAYDQERWARVEVRTDPVNKRRPKALWMGGSWHQLEILGRYTGGGIGAGESGYRARLEPGIDVTLVRERLGVWYAHDLPDV